MGTQGFRGLGVRGLGAKFQKSRGGGWRKKKSEIKLWPTAVQARNAELRSPVFQKFLREMHARCPQHKRMLGNSTREPTIGRTVWLKVLGL